MFLNFKIAESYQQQETEVKYIAKEKQSIRTKHNTKHKQSIIPQTKHLNLDMQYADNICKVSTDCNSIQRFKDETPKLLTKRDITINESKTEEYKINKNSRDWKKCKYLSSMLDTSEDIKR